MGQSILAATFGPIALAECAIFSAALNSIPGLEELGRPGPWTVLVPTDAAFAALSTEATNDPLYHPLPLTELLRMHLVQGVVAGRHLAGTGWLVSARGDRLPVDAFGAEVLIDGALVVRADLPLAGGLAHVIDRVLRYER